MPNQHRDTEITEIMEKKTGAGFARAKIFLRVLRASVLNLGSVATMLLASSLGIPAAAAAAPKVHIATLADLPIEEMRPYDEAANADAAVNAVFARAKRSHKRVLIDLGGNWCGDCIILDNVMQIPEVKRFVNAHYEMVSIDVGRFNRNLQIPARFGITKRLEGVPTVLIATPDGKLVNEGHTAALADARSMTPQAIADWIAQWTGK
jgi:thiol-disulfide isomerase/thioredoxin